MNGNFLVSRGEMFLNCLAFWKHKLCISLTIWRVRSPEFPGRPGEPHCSPEACKASPLLWAHGRREVPGVQGSEVPGKVRSALNSEVISEQEKPWAQKGCPFGDSHLQGALREQPPGDTHWVCHGRPRLPRGLYQRPALPEEAQHQTTIRLTRSSRRHTTEVRRTLPSRPPARDALFRNNNLRAEENISKCLLRKPGILHTTFCLMS